MHNLDLTRSLAPVINLTDVPTLEAMLRASTCERVAISIDHIPDSGRMVIPVRIIEGMEEVTSRGTVTEEQFSLMEALLDLLQSSPVLKVN